MPRHKGEIVYGSEDELEWYKWRNSSLLASFTETCWTHMALYWYHMYSVIHIISKLLLHLQTKQCCWRVLESQMIVKPNNMKTWHLCKTVQREATVSRSTKINILESLPLGGCSPALLGDCCPMFWGSMAVLS
jgi:hypothetical protein